MNACRSWISVALATLCIGFLAAHVALGEAPTSQSPTKARARTVLSKTLPKLDGEHLNVTLVEVRYGPGEASSPHSHACPVMAYVVRGAVRTQVEGSAETIYKAGESFYEAPNAVHLVSANASVTEPATFVAYLICDRDTLFSVDPSKSTRPKGASR